MTMDEADTSPGRRPRSGESGAPVGSILSIVLAVVAVLIGLFILRQIDDDGDGGATDPDTTLATGESSDSTDPDATTGTGTGPVDTIPPPTVDVRTGAVVVVANANTTGGSASQMSEQLEDAGFTMSEPTDGAGEERQLDESKVYFQDGNRRARNVALTLARLLGGVQVQKLPGEIPVEGGETDGEVILMLGVDAAGKQLDELGG